MKFWISKYALTQGVFEVEAEKVTNFNETETDMISYKDNGHLIMYHGEGKEFHLTKEDAIKKAEEMRLKKIESYKKSITRLEKMKFK